jgi:sensor histidine kinase YesM
MGTVEQVLPISMSIDRIVRSNRWHYWSLQATGWGAYAFFIMLQNWMLKEMNVSSVLFTMTATVLGLLLSMAMRESYRLIWNHPPVKRALLTLSSLGVASGIWSMWKLYVSYEISAHMEIKNIYYECLAWFCYSFCILLSWTALYYCIKYYKMVHAEHEKALRAEAMAHQAKLKMLRYQLNPHFLFNTLNSISTLVLDQRGNMANRMIEKLSRFMRYSLDNDPMQKVPLDTELEAMKLYLEIEMIRFGARLQIVYDVEDAARPACIPSLLLQPLIENAIKYAVAVSETGGTIRIAARVAAGELCLEVSDNGPGIPGCAGSLQGASGVGLMNTRERLRTLYGGHQSFHFTNMEPHGLRIDIRLPMEVQDPRARWKN